MKNDMLSDELKYLLVYHIFQRYGPLYEVTYSNQYQAMSL